MQCAGCSQHNDTCFLQEAVSLGIPETAMPAVGRRPDYACLRDARDQLRGMMESFVSANI